MSHARLGLSLVALFGFAACAPEREPTDGGNAGAADLAGADFSGDNSQIIVEPAGLQTITVLRGQSTPTVGYTAKIGGTLVPVAWSVDRGDVGSAAPGPAPMTTVSPTGTTGGMLTVRARLGLTTVERKIFIQLDGGVQNGLDPSNAAEQKQVPASTDDLKLGGGVGGVGGEGLGPAVSTPSTLTALQTPTTNGQAEGLTLLYPYDGTVWPRGMLAPLLMWRWTPGDADAIRIELATTSGSFKYVGTFGRPAILATTAGPFIRHPIPQDVWDAATNTAGGTTPTGEVDKLTVKITIAKNGVGYGPLTQTWPIAPARLTGTVYYNSYGTQLVKNWGGVKDSAGNTIGAAILAVRSGDTDPRLIIGQNSPVDAMGVPTNNDGCRVCHIVASRGRWLITQGEGNTNKDTYLYDLNATDVQASAVELSPDGTFSWAAMVGDGSYALTNTVNPSSSNPSIIGGDESTAVSGFWQFGPTPVPQGLTGLPTGIAAGYPSYSPDDRLVSFVDATGSNADLKNRPLKVASYDATSRTFSNLQTIYTPPLDHRVGYPSFLPDNSGVLFEHELRKGADTVVTTRNCGRSELWWTKLGGSSPVGLKNLNGVGPNGSYLPTGGKNHGIAETGDPQCNVDETGQNDTTLSYEPTVLPLVAGGYAWVVFTSRRLYGNQLTNFPWNSWPQNYDTRDLAQATVKKLWVAAIDLNAPSGADPSHPAFYLPAQELLAGNSRGFWVLDPCRANGQGCESGDQCCNGYCQPDPANPTSPLVCTDTAACAGLQEKCINAADCCDTSNLCVNGFCATAPIL